MMQAHFAFPAAAAMPSEEQDQASGSFKYLLDTTRGNGPPLGELAATIANLTSNGLLQPAAA